MSQDPSTTPERDDQGRLHDGEMPAPYPDDTPGGVLESGEDQAGADLVEDAERLTDDSE